MVNHLYRGREIERWKQSKLLREWGEAETLPVIATGDYNYDWDVVSGDNDHDPGYDSIVLGGEWQWVRPEFLEKTQASTSYNSVLDFVFISGFSENTSSASEIIVKPGNFPDDNTTPDHRPVWAKITVGTISGNNDDNGQTTMAGLRIKSCLPNPVGENQGNEQITLYNSGDTPINLIGWMVRDKANHYFGPNGIVLENDQFTITLPAGELPLNNNGTETIDLISPSNQVVFTASYNGTTSGEVIEFDEQGNEI